MEAHFNIASWVNQSTIYEVNIRQYTPEGTFSAFENHIPRLKEISKLEEWTKHFLEKSILRTLSKAVYSDENFGHFWLWLTFYSHFTSPIRRYPDLQIHRIIKEKLNNKLDNNRLIHYKSILDEVWKHTSDKERKAEKERNRSQQEYGVKF